jgi:hypothetical protein
VLRRGTLGARGGMPCSLSQVRPSTVPWNASSHRIVRATAWALQAPPPTRPVRRCAAPGGLRLEAGETLVDPGLGRMLGSATYVMRQEVGEHHANHATGRVYV